MAADAHLVTLRPQFSGIVLPSKIYACLATRRPIVFVGPQSSDVHLLCLKARAPSIDRSIRETLPPSPTLSSDWPTRAAGRPSPTQARFDEISQPAWPDDVGRARYWSEFVRPVRIPGRVVGGHLFGRVDERGVADVQVDRSPFENRDLQRQVDRPRDGCRGLI